VQGEKIINGMFTVEGQGAEAVTVRYDRHEISQNPKSRKAKRLMESVVFSTPRFYLAPDLNQKKARIKMQVNG